jgi:hypothetical protein
VVVTAGAFGFPAFGKPLNDCSIVEDLVFAAVLVSDPDPQPAMPVTATRASVTQRTRVATRRFTAGSVKIPV